MSCPHTVRYTATCLQTVGHSSTFEQSSYSWALIYRTFELSSKSWAFGYILAVLTQLGTRLHLICPHTVGHSATYELSSYNWALGYIRAVDVQLVTRLYFSCPHTVGHSAIFQLSSYSTVGHSAIFEQSSFSCSVINIGVFQITRLGQGLVFLIVHGYFCIS